MTLVEAVDVLEIIPDADTRPIRARGEEPASPARPSNARIRVLLVFWIAALIASLGLVMYGFGPFLQQREQRTLLRDYRVAVGRAANQASGLRGVADPKTAPERGAPVGILEIGPLKLQQVIVEGVSSSETRVGPGHVPGTAGPGQPGNSVVVARNKAFGGVFNRLRSLHNGDEILVTTTQGQTVYDVAEVRANVTLSTTGVDDVYGPSDDDRLTLITASSASPWNKSRAVIVVAKMRTVAFAPTPQNGRTKADTGMTGDRGALSSVILAMMAYGVVMGASVMLFRRLQLRTAYLLTIAPMLAVTIIAAETISRLMPAWM